MIFLVLLGKMMFLFFQNMILRNRRKMKDDLFLKSTQKYDIFFKPSEKMVFPKWPCRHMIFLVLSGKMVLFSRRHDIFPWAESEKRPFGENTWKYDIFCVHVRVLQTLRHVSLSKKKKNQRWSYPSKIHLKVTGVLDQHPRKSSSNSLHFHGGLYRRFLALLSSDKKPGNLIYGIEVCLLLQFIRLEIFYNE